MTLRKVRQELQLGWQPGLQLALQQKLPLKLASQASPHAVSRTATPRDPRQARGETPISRMQCAPAIQHQLCTLQISHTPQRCMTITHKAIPEWPFCAPHNQQLQDWWTRVRNASTKQARHSIALCNQDALTKKRQGEQPAQNV